MHTFIIKITICINSGLTTDHHSKLFEDLFEARTEYRNLGLALGLQHEDLTAIDKKCLGDCDRGLEEMLHTRITMAPPLYRDDVVQALKKDTVGRCDLADKLEQQWQGI